MSHITTHILDTSKGRPAEGVLVRLSQEQLHGWVEIGSGTTGNDGKVTELLKEEIILEPGLYRLRFETQDYYNKRHLQTFYPYIEITFDVKEDEHYHIPLLLNPFGYSTYRGS